MRSNTCATAFEYLIHSWETIVELLSIYKRLKGFEVSLSGDVLPPIEAEGVSVVS